MDISTGTIDCVLQSTAPATCTESFGGKDASDPDVSTGILQATGITYIPATITAGARTGPTCITSSGAVSTTASSSTTSVSNTAGTATSQTSGPATTGASTSSSSSTGSKRIAGSTTLKSAIVGSASGTAPPSAGSARAFGTKILFWSHRCLGNWVKGHAVIIGIGTVTGVDSSTRRVAYV